MASTEQAPLPVSPPPLRRPADLPGPFPWPLVGNLLQFDRQNLHAQIEAWARRHGPVYRLRFGRTDAVVVSDPDTIQQALRDRPDTWRRYSRIQSVMDEIGIQGVFTAEGETWRRQRRIVMSAFDPAHLRRFFPSLLRVTDRLRQRWIDAARHGEVLNLQRTLMRYTVDVTAGLAFGVEMNTIQKEHSELHSHLDKVFPMVFRRANSPLPYWRWLTWLPSVRAFDVHVRAVHRVVGELIAAAQTRLEAEPRRCSEPADLLEALLAARDDEGRPLTEQEVAGNVFTMLLAGEDTTANTLAWTIYFLSRHPEAWRRVVEEVDTTLAPAALPPSLEAAGALSFTEACIHEAMRLHPVAPVRELEACEDTQIDGLLIPKGAVLVCMMRAATLDENRIEHAQEFRPQRWLEGRQALNASSPKRLSMPFGAGPRLCPGRYLAMLEMSMVLAMLARNFELREVGTREGPVAPERLASALLPIGLRMRLSERRPR
ncbi:cytochrome P450 [Aquabacterium sp. A7-Y]|uniref:cytochrome P450 n=1 Tax=Aquabacterium sp. A7-Y TaxID=1349605 RepID=UPI00223CE8E2|nr:cytochrome P450 [Aquabacterium sp. A7-Y]MCW7539636.1 cytochrome P450 [Aquabacterium sp. A7-Y]